VTIILIYLDYALEFECVKVDARTQ